MKNIFSKQALVGAVITVLAGVGILAPSAYAEGSGFSMSPMKQSIVLDPGETYQTLLSISNPGTNDGDFSYSVRVLPFYVNENYQSVFEENGNYSQIVDWITLDSPTTGSIAPNESRDIYFTISVPEWAPAGGQYASILVSSAGGGSGEGMTINEQVAIGHILYVEITGDTVKQGEFLDVSVPGFLFSGYIGGNSAIKNTGNTHGTAKYTLQVYPLFSSEEIYTNEEEPNTHIIVPDRIYYDNDTVWAKTPAMGIFNVVYTVEYEGVTKQVSKLVIKCPIWLLFIIIFAVVAIIVWIATRILARGKKRTAGRE
jgi:hypothetical protein